MNLKDAKGRLKQPTPRLWKRIGNALFAVFTTVSGFFAYIDDKKIALAFILIGALGKFITELSIEKNEK